METPCIIWTKARNEHGYGLVRREGKMYKAHRLAWVKAFGPIPEGMNVCHRCDNPPCVNPDHLFLGTQSQNILDMYRKGRRGTLYTIEEVREIRRLYAQGMRNRDIYKQFGCKGTTQCISRICMNLNWTHVA